VIAAVVYWNSTYLADAIDRPHQQRHAVPAELLAHPGTSCGTGPLPQPGNAGSSILGRNGRMIRWSPGVRHRQHCVRSGGKADDTLFHVLRGKRAAIHTIGDYYQPRDIEISIVHARRVARELCRREGLIL
jgi:hypothetical protein